MQTNVEALCCTHKTNIILHVKCTSIKEDKKGKLKNNFCSTKFNKRNLKVSSKTD